MVLQAMLSTSKFDNAFNLLRNGVWDLVVCYSCSGFYEYWRQFSVNRCANILQMSFGLFQSLVSVCPFVCVAHTIQHPVKGMHELGQVIFIFVCSSFLSRIMES